MPIYTLIKLPLLENKTFQNACSIEEYLVTFVQDLVASNKNTPKTKLPNISCEKYVLEYYENLLNNKQSTPKLTKEFCMMLDNY